MLVEKKKKKVVEMKSNYAVPKGVWIPDIYIEQTELTIYEMHVLSIVKSLSEQGLCFARNDYFAAVMHVSNRTVTRALTSLENRKMIVIKNGCNHQRIIKLNDRDFYLDIEYKTSWVFLCDRCMDEGYRIFEEGRKEGKYKGLILVNRRDREYLRTGA